MIRLCINSQTPPIRPIDGARSSKGVWKRDVDYVPNVGGVVPMMQALLRSGAGRWIGSDPRWVAMGGRGLPKELRTDEGFWVETVDIPETIRAAYTRFKDSVWRSFHGPELPDRFSPDYRAFVEYNFRHASRLLRHVDEFDIFYVNDFQQILVGGLIGSAAPAILRWHIPLELRGYPEPVRRFFLKAMEGFDAIVVSTRSGLEELIRAGFHGRAFQVYPYIDPATQTTAPDAEVQAFRDRFGLGQDPYLLSVSRMDPVKRQDLLVDAFSLVRRTFPRLRLVLVGGQSFSTRMLPSDKRAWADGVVRQVRERSLDESVVFTGDLSAAEVQAAYSGAEALVHPAPWEGFGLVVVEAWMHSLPVIVSRGAGVSELVEDGVNGFTVRPGSVKDLARGLRKLLRQPELARRMGEVGALTARRCRVDRAAPKVREIFERAIELYARAGLRPVPRTHQWS